MVGLHEDWTDPEIITKDTYPAINHIHNKCRSILIDINNESWLDLTLEDFPIVEENELDYYPIS